MTENAAVRRLGIRAQPSKPREPGTPSRAPGGASSRGSAPASAQPGGLPAAAQATVTTADVPERPALAEGVELAGQMEDSAYEQQPWLVLRNGGFVQVSELLYRLAEACDGQRDHEAIARALSEAIGRRATADNVRQLLERKLIPMGIVPKSDGTVVNVGGGAGNRSPLKISLKTAQVPPRLVQPLARVFGVLFAPPIALGILAVAGAAIGWLLFVHGVGGGFHGALYQPWLIVVLLPLIVASAAFHEFGHAAALAYGGGKVRGMGAGIYFVYPVFFTDVTDNYRLKRGSKVRTDLGGFYFNLIFALGVMGLYLVTGQEFLLLGVVAIVFGIVHQLMPIMRLDGYWALADLTGIPDPFSAMKPFVRSLLPFGRRAEGTPEMKRWVKALFLLYIVIAVPLLVVLVAYTIAIAPRIIATTVDSFGQQVAQLGPAVAAGDAVGVAGRVLGLAVLTLTALGIVVFVYRTGKSVLGRLWGWAGDSWGRRTVARTATLAMAGALALAWAPPMPAVGLPAGPFHGFTPIQAGEDLSIQRGLTEGFPALSGQSNVGQASPSPSGTGPGASSAPGGGPAASSPPGGPGSSTPPAPGTTPRPTPTPTPRPPAASATPAPTPPTTPTPPPASGSAAP
jgi:putative peptide zinc metalloprotease protein